MARRKTSLLGFAGKSESMPPLWGAIAGGTVSAGTTIAVRTFVGKDKWAEAIGMGAGAVVGGAMLMNKRTKTAGALGIAAAVAAGLPRVIEAMLSKKQQLKDIQGTSLTAQKLTPEELSAMIQAAKPLGGSLGAAAMERRTLAAASAARVPSLGAASASRVPSLGALPSFQGGGLPSFQGGGLGIISPEVVKSIGGGAGGISGLGASYGATIASGN